MDVHFRHRNKVDFYFGLTTLATLQWLASKSILRVRAHSTHRRKYGETYGGECAEDLFRDWSPNDEFRERLQNYLRDVEVDEHHIEKEGRVQLSWSGGQSEIEPWITFDREARLEYETKAYREETKKFPEVDSAYEQLLDRHQRGKDGLSKSPEMTAEKLDRLAIDHDGNLVLAELKSLNSGDRSQIYYAPFQLLQYIWEWYSALGNWPNLWDQVQELLDSRVNLQLAPKPRLRLSERRRIRAAVCFGSEGPKNELTRPYRSVLCVANQHLPSDVDPIETWTYRELPRRWEEN